MLNLIAMILVICLLLVDIFLVELENFGWITLSIIFTGVIICDFKLWGIPYWIAANLKLCIGFFVLYFVVGVLWSFIKWYSYLINYRDQFATIKDNFIFNKRNLIESQYEWASANHIEINNKIVSKEVLPFDFYAHHNILDNYYAQVKDGKKIYNAFVESEVEYKEFYKPVAASNKGRIVAWICYWPWSLVATIVNDPIRRLVEWIFRFLKETYQKMSDKIFADFPDKKRY